MTLMPPAPFASKPTLIAGALVLLALILTGVAGSQLPARAAEARAEVLPVRAVELAPPEAGAPVLSVRATDGMRAYDMAALESLGTHAMEASLIWEDEDDVYHGVLLSDLLADAGLETVPAVRVRALDGYTSTIPREDWTRWPIMVATRRAGAPMSVREKGPLRILYPLPPETVLAMPQMDNRWVWMLTAIEPETAGP